MSSVLLFFFFFFELTGSCSIFSSLTCECFQSDADLPSSIYSHLHCRGSFSSGQRLDLPLGDDAFRFNRFRTVNLDFTLEGQTEIFAEQFSNLSCLFVSTPVNSPVEISLRFNHFTELLLHRSALATNISQPKHFQLTFLPFRTNDDSPRFEEDEEEEQLKFSPETFAGLIVPELTLHIPSMRDRLSSSMPFERIFANSDIGHLHLHGSLIPPGVSVASNGLIRSLTVYRRVDTIDAKTFPPYPSVGSYRIHSLEAHSMNLSSFQADRFDNLRGLELINPRFPVAIDEYLPRLDWLSLDVEHLTERTFHFARHIQSLKIGARLRRIDSNVFYSFPSRLKHLDLSQVDLAELTPDSLCYLIHYLSHLSQRETHLVFPRTSSVKQCNCPRLFLQAIRKPPVTRRNTQACAKRCRFTDCQTISEFFRKKFPLGTEQQQQQPDDGLPSVDFAGDDVDGSLMGFIISQTEPRSHSHLFPSLVVISRILDRPPLLSSSPKRHRKSNKSNRTRQNPTNQPKTMSLNPRKKNLPKRSHPNNPKRRSLNPPNLLKRSAPNNPNRRCLNLPKKSPPNKPPQSRCPNPSESFLFPRCGCFFLLVCLSFGFSFFSSFASSNLDDTKVTLFRINGERERENHMFA